MQKDLVKQILASLFRKFLVLIFGVLVTPLVLHGWLSTDLGKTIEGSLDNWAVLLAASVITFAWPLIWGAWEKIVARARVILALQTPPTVPVASVEQQVSELPRVMKFRLGTSPGNVPVPNVDDVLRSHNFKNGVKK